MSEPNPDYDEMSEEDRLKFLKVARRMSGVLIHVFDGNGKWLDTVDASDLPPEHDGVKFMIANIPDDHELCRVDLVIGNFTFTHHLEGERTPYVGERMFVLALP